MSLSTALEILQVGLSGFVFLLLYLSYRLHSQVLKGVNVSPDKQRAVGSYTVLVLASIVVVVSYNVWSVYAKPHDGIGLCRDSLSRLDTSAGQPSGSAEDLRVFIQSHVSICQDVLERLDER